MSAGCHFREIFSCKKTLFTGPVPVKKTLSCIPVRIWENKFSCPVFLYDFSVQAKKSCPCSCKQDAEPSLSKDSRKILEKHQKIENFWNFRLTSNFAKATAPLRSTDFRENRSAPCVWFYFANLYCHHVYCENVYCVQLYCVNRYCAISIHPIWIEIFFRKIQKHEMIK